MAAAQAAEQRARQVAAAAYDYDGDPRWSEYWENIFMPPQMASVPEIIEHLKRKFYQRFIDPDLIVDALPAGPTSASTSGSFRPQPPGSSTGPFTRPGRGNNQLMMQLQAVHFAVNAWVVAVAMLGIIPILTANLTRKVCRLSLLGTIISSLYCLCSLYGKPREYTIPAIQMWLQTVIVTIDFIRLMFCLTLVTSKADFRLAVIPVLCWSLDHVSRFLRRHFTRSSFYRRYLEMPCIWVEQNNNTLNFLSSYAEVALGFLLIISLLSWRRSVMHAFMYWNLLKLMYHAPATSVYHRSVWSNIGNLINPYINSHAPFLSTPIATVQGWWFR